MTRLEEIELAHGRTSLLGGTDGWPSSTAWLLSRLRQCEAALRQVPDNRFVACKPDCLRLVRDALAALEE